jgi:hypothetical protein
MRAVLNTKRTEKIRWFARLLAAHVHGDAPLCLSDEYEESLRVLEDLSYRELAILAILHKYEKASPESEEDALQRVFKYWHPFKSEVAARLGIAESEIPSALVRLTRAGVYFIFTEYIGGSDDATGQLTALYYRLASLISISDEEIPRPEPDGVAC